MEHGLGSDSVPLHGPVDKSRVLNVKPLRCLVPVFPAQPDSTGFPTPQSSPFACVPPTGPFPPGIAPFYPFFIPSEPQRTPISATNQTRTYPIPSPIPLNSYRTPASAERNGNIGSSASKHQNDGVVDEDGYDNSEGQGTDPYMNSYEAEEIDDVEGRRRTRRRPRTGQPLTTSNTDVDIDSFVNNILRSFSLLELDSSRREVGDRDLVERLVVAFNLLRRKITQIDDSNDSSPGTTRRPDLRSGTIMLNKGARSNARKRIGLVPGVEVGDIFFFRMETCLIGLHSPSMAGIDYMSVKISGADEPLAVSIVSSGGYEDEGNDGEVLIYSGQGGVQRRDKQVMDQKLERGNLALEKSLHRANEVRVIRGIKDGLTQTGKVYLYDGLYKIHESWVERGKAGCNVFKYKMVRVPGQAEAFTLWKAIQHWKEGLTTRNGVILPDLTSGAENLPVSLVNDVDSEKGPAYFDYFSSLKYVKPFDSLKPSSSCSCHGGCKPGNDHCPCIQRNEGFLPYSQLSVLLSHNVVIHECGMSCSCPSNCRNRVSQAGLKLRLEVFKTKDKGWGLRSWDPIRAGAFICEYAGEVIDASMLERLVAKSDDNYVFDATRVYEPIEPSPEEHNEFVKALFPLFISAKNGGNVARFMNHSCSPNVYWQPVLRESNNEAYLHIGFYAIKHIPPMRELVYNYGTIRGDSSVLRKKICLCGSSRCKGYFY